MMMYKNFVLKLILLLVLVGATPAFTNDWLYTVRPNEAASKIGKSYLVNPYRIDEVLAYNNIVDADNLVAGTVLKIPVNYLKFGPARVQVTSVQGNVLIQNAYKESPLSTLHSVKLGDKIITGESSSAMLRFADGSELLLGSQSELIFDVLTQWGRTGMVDSRMRLLKGSAEGRVNKLQGSKSKFEVHTPSAVATVRGTEFRVRVGKDNSSVSFNEVSEGKVQVANNAAASLVPMGFGLVAEEGKKSDNVIELLPAPNLIGAELEYYGTMAELAWQQEQGAKAYRLELFEGNEAVSLIDSNLLSSAKAKIENLAVGDYTVRVRSVDDNGLEGLDRQHSFFVNGKILPPKRAASLTHFDINKKVEMSWQKDQMFSAYHYQVSDSKTFDNILRERETRSSKVTLRERLPIGTYYWRVLGKSTEKNSSYSLPIPFTVHLPKTIKVEVFDVKEGEAINAKWNNFGQSQKFEWQLATDKEFKNITQQGTTNENKVALKATNKGYYYFRVAQIVDGKTLAFTQPEAIMIY